MEIIQARDDIPGEMAEVDCHMQAAEVGCQLERGESGSITILVGFGPSPYLKVRAWADEQDWLAVVMDLEMLKVASSFGVFEEEQQKRKCLSD